MSKYICKKCHGPATYQDLISPLSGHCAVYVCCPNCNREAFGGLNFHPEMNEVLNAFFEADFSSTESHPLKL